jgi:ABC-type nitrate/sulfonate/bicarbonate transport system substrate-binding protein
MKPVRIVGVPEHFNLPWHLCIENSEFDQVGIDLQWTDVPEGTGKMCQMLRNEETDIAVLLTEGIIKDITSGNDSSIVQIYVQSPLIWGIHVSNNSKFTQLSDLKNTTAAISRIGSGSHLMSFVNAKQQNWDTSNLKFEIVNTIDGAVEALQNEKAHYFMWERFMTKPLVDDGTFRKIADCPTPWPCFVIAVRNEFLKNNAATVELILDIINNTTIEFKEIPSIFKYK